jgi:endonuclease/exonuclease/phosphatase family metal-dependent hydrolase
MRIATFNIYWLGTSRTSIVRRTPEDEALIARVLAGLDADVLALQEICCQTTLERVLSLVNTATGRRYTTVHGGAWVSSARDGEALDRGAQKVCYVWDAGTTAPLGWQLLPGAALRPALIAAFPGVSLGAVHLKSGIHGAPMTDPSAQQRHLEAGLLAGWGGAATGPALILGDLNARAGDPSIAPLEAIPGWHWPAPDVPEAWTAFHDHAVIDHIGANTPLRTRAWAWDRDPRFGIDFHAVGGFVAQRVRDVPPAPVEELYRVSDHRPVYVDL